MNNNAYMIEDSVRYSRIPGLLATLCCLLGLMGCGRSKQPPAVNASPTTSTVANSASWPTPASSASETHKSMVRALQEVIRGTADTNVWVGDAQARVLRTQLQGLSGDAPLADRGRIKMKLAEAELKLGNEQEAIRLLRECDEQLFPKLTASWSAAQRRALQNMLKFSLGVSYMRLGETQNCCQLNSPDSCIMPIQGKGLHANPHGSQQAIHCFTQVLENEGAGTTIWLRARWLLNIAHMTLGEYPDQVPERYLIPPDRFLSGEPFPRFVNVGQQKGVATFSLSGGAIADDFDNDRFIDLVVSSYAPDAQLRFFHNNGDGTFTDRTREAGLEGITGGLNLVQADYDNDGWLDILVLRGAWLGAHGKHPNSLLRNDGVSGSAQFTDVTFGSGLAEVSYPTQTAAWADFDNDGDVDLYVGNEADQIGQPTVALGTTVAPTSVAPSQLFENVGDGTFRDVAAEAGVTNDRFAKAVVWGDYDGDRWPDLYVSNFLDQNRLYRNNGDGTFHDVAAEAGVGGPHASFPAWFWDFDNDGNLDIYASSWSGDISSLAANALGLRHDAELACLYRGDGRGNFVDVTTDVGLTHPTGPMGSNFGDLDGDGYCDFYLGTGEPELMNLMPNVMYVNRAGKRFADVTIAGGFGHLQKGHAVAFADFDNDGDQDVFEQMGGAYPGDKFYDALYENPGFGHAWLSFKLVGRTSNRSAVGARILIEVLDADTGTTRTIYRWVNSGGSFGANPLQQTIGLGHASKVQRLKVFWPTTGRTQVWTRVPLNVAIEIVEGNQQLATVRTPQRDGSIAH